MSKTITFTVPDEATCGDVSKSIVKMLIKNYEEGALGNIMFFVDKALQEKFKWEDEND